MSTDSDTSDDLIAELAKLMAQDAQSEKTSKTAEPSREIPAVTVAPAQQAPAPVAAGPTSPVRIPGATDAQVGGGAQPAGATPLKFDFGKPPVAEAAFKAPEPLVWQDRSETKPTDTNVRVEPNFGAAAPMQGKLPDRDAPDGGQDFDFGFGGNKPKSDNQVEAQSDNQVEAQAEKPQPQQRKLEPLARIEPVSSFDPVPKINTPAAAQSAPQSAKPTAPAMDVPQMIPEEHDVIADLIAAEFAAEKPAPAPVAVTPVNLAPQNHSGGNITPLTPRSASPQQRQAGGPALRSVNLTPKTVAQESDKFVTSPVFGLGSKPQSPKPESAHAEPVITKPAAVIPPQELDPIDEIESLIGEAVRVELGNKAGPAPAAASKSAVVTPFALRRATPQPEPQVETPDSAEEAILAAAAVTGAEVGRIEAEFEEPARKRRGKKERAARLPREARAPGSFRQFVGPAVAGTLLLLAGFGLYWVLGMGRPSDANAPVLTADTAAVKELPTTPAVDPTATQGSVVFDELDGVTTGGAEETLVSRDQADSVDVAAVTADTTEATETTLANRKVRTVTVRPDGTIVSGDDAVAGTAELPVDRPNVPDLPATSTALGATDLLTGTEAGLPSDASALTDPSTALPTDGTTTGTDPAGTDATAAATAPLDPNMPIPMPRPSWRDGNAALDTPIVTTPAADTAPAIDTAATTSPVTAVVDEPAPTLADATPVGEDTAIEVASLDPVATDTTAPAPDPLAAIVTEATAEPVTPVVTETATIAADEPVVETALAVTEPAVETPVVETALAVTEPVAEPTVETPPVEQVAAVEPTPAVTSSNAAAWVQVSSQRSEADAQATMAQIQSKYGILFNGTALEVQRADLGAKGIYYRVVLPVDSKASANQICADLVEAGGECITR